MAFFEKKYTREFFKDDKIALVFWTRLCMHVFFQIDLTDYSRLPNGLVSMFASFSLTSARKGYVPTFLHEFVCCLA